MALARGMQAFEISAAKHINAACAKAGSWWARRHGGAKRRKGAVFPDRYHAEIITRRPRSWLLREGWRRYGLIRTTEVPSAVAAGSRETARA